MSKSKAIKQAAFFETKDTDKLRIKYRSVTRKPRSLIVDVKFRVCLGKAVWSDAHGPCLKIEISRTIQLEVLG